MVGFNDKWDDERLGSLWREGNVMRWGGMNKAIMNERSQECPKSPVKGKKERVRQKKEKAKGGGRLLDTQALVHDLKQVLVLQRRCNSLLVPKLLVDCTIGKQPQRKTAGMKA